MNFYDNGDGTYRYSYTDPEKTPQKQKKEKKEKKGLKFIVLTLVAAIIIGLVGGGVAFGTFKAGLALFPADGSGQNDGKVHSGTSVSGTAVSTAVAVNDVSDIAKNVMPAIVQVTNMSVVEYRGFFGHYFSEPVESAGSGVIIADDGKSIFIATNNHVVAGSQELTVTFSTESEEAVGAQLQGTYPAKDIAVVKVSKDDISEETIAGIKVASLADAKDIVVGQATVAIGNALGYGQSVTTGIVSALEREVSISDDQTGEVMSNKLIQTDAAINPGNSGGALLNMNGEVIGIVSAKYSSTEVEGMGYAIPINQAKEIADEIIATGSYTNKETNDSEDESGVVADNGAYLGIYGGMDIDHEKALRYDMPTGVYVSQVIEGSGADKAGIKGGDVIRGIDGKSVSSMMELKGILAKYKPKDSIKVSVAVAESNYEDREYTVILGEKED